MTAAILLEKLSGVRQTGPSRWIATCPGHADRTPSLSVRELDDGRVLVKDFGGCDVHTIVKSVGLTLGDLFPERPPRSGHEPVRRETFNARDVLACLAHEVTVVLIVARQLEAGDVLNDDDRAQLSLAARRIGEAEGFING